MATKTKTLNDMMDFDTIIMVGGDLKITERPKTEHRAPELHAMSDGEGQHLTETDAELHREARAAGWELETGWTGQDSYNGPCMHSSESVGGGLETHIRETPGYWCVTIIWEDDGEPESWAICHRPLD